VDFEYVWGNNMMNGHTSLSEQELLRLLQQNDDLAFQELYNRYWSKLFYVSHKRLKSAMAAEEIVQDVFFTLWRKRNTLQIGNLSHYLGAMTRYAVYRYLAAEKRRAENEGEAGKESPALVPGELLIDNKHLLEMVKQLANELPEKCRMVFIYNKIDDQTLPEVAKRLNISLKTAEAHLTKALRVIRRRVRDHSLLMFINL
jgi:RNA polymerase sigma-70 factor (family 1)